MGKYLLLVLVVVAVLMVLRAAGQAKLRRSAADRPKPGAGAEEGEPMVSCFVCGVNLPRSESLISGARSYCCEEHRRAAG